MFWLERPVGPPFAECPDMSGHVRGHLSNSPLLADAAAIAPLKRRAMRAIALLARQTSCDGRIPHAITYAQPSALAGGAPPAFNRTSRRRPHLHHRCKSARAA